MSEGARIRLFVAVQVPDQVKLAISEAQHDLRKVFRNQAISWTRPEQFHLTLRFVGWVAESRILELSMVLDQTAARYREFQINAAGTGCFPNAARPRVVWVGLDEVTGTLCDLQRAIEQSVSPFSDEPPENRFHPHVTLARVKQADRNSSRLITGWAERYRGKSFGQWRSGSVALVQSVLSPNGAIYSVLHESVFTSR